MVSITPISQISTNYGDLCNCRYPPCPVDSASPSSLTGIIYNDPRFKKFSYILKLSKLEHLYNNQMSDYTIFVPDDSKLKFSDSVYLNMDILTAQNIVKYSTLAVPKKITSDILKDSPASYFLTKNSPNRLYITNISQDLVINGNVRIIFEDYQADNGIIHIVDNLLWPDFESSYSPS
jgi:uncharacterized surface protein with fasciclin (FAS1) repeats